MSVERVYLIDWLRVICKGSKVFIYLLVLAWLVWFTRTSHSQLRVRKRTAAVLLFIAVDTLLAVADARKYADKEAKSGRYI